MLITAALGLMAAVGGRGRAEEGSAEKWLDVENCDICKAMAENPALMKSVAWETHLIDNGALCVVTVPKEMMKDFEACGKKMEAAIEKAKSGEKMEFCGACESMGKLMEAGVKSKEIKIANGMIHLMTSDDPALVKQIHEHAKKTIEVQKEMAKEKPQTALR
jgi:hypothetical protein